MAASQNGGRRWHSRIQIRHPHLKFKIQVKQKCTNNQAEQLAILKSLEYIENIHTTDKSVTIYTDSQTTLDSLQNNNIHTYLIEKIRRKATELE